MAHRTPLLLATLLLPYASLLAQDAAPSADGNLVPNGGFETVKGKLKKEGGIAQATGWTSPTESKADLFGESAEGTPVAVPKNAFGEQAPLGGSHYAGLRWWSQMDRQPRSYIQAKLRNTLSKGTKYCVKFNVSLSDLSRYGVNEVGAFLSPIVIEKDDMANLTYAAQVPADRTAVLSDMQEWKGVCGLYQAEGHEEYIIIGNFAATEKTLTAKLKRPKGEVRPQVMNAYYFIDDVSVVPVQNDSECSCAPAAKKGEAAVGLIFSRSSVADPKLGAADKLDRQVFYFKPLQGALDRSMEPWIAETAALMKEDAAVRVRLTGHIDVQEKERTQQALAWDRAEAVKASLVAAGIEAARIESVQPEANAPVDPNNTEVGMSKNRRVEVKVVR